MLGVGGILNLGWGGEWCLVWLLEWFRGTGGLLEVELLVWEE